MSKTDKRKIKRADEDSPALACSTDDEPIVVKIKTYTITHYHMSDATTIENRTCDGFTPWELLGMIERIRIDIHKQMDKEIAPPTKVIREAVEGKS